MSELTGEILGKLLNVVFPPFAGDRKMAILVDFPINTAGDNSLWKTRRDLALNWFCQLQGSKEFIPEINLIGYADVGSNNADLPETVYLLPKDLPDYSPQLEQMGIAMPLERVYGDYQLFMAPTEYSTTAPLKTAAKRYPFRAATMGGFSEKMLPAMLLDYSLVGSRVDFLKQKLDEAQGAQVIFEVDAKEYHCFFDLRFRQAHASSGIFSQSGMAGNFPSGEAYIVPYEGEKEQKSLSKGEIPVQFEDGMVFYTIENNRAVSVKGEGKAAKREAELLQKEPAYANIAELGFGVLEGFGIEPIGEVLLDEKLGFHIAFGRSDHFGGSVGPEHFSRPEAVVHIDRIYIPQTQPAVKIKSLVFEFLENKREQAITQGRYIYWQDS